MCLCPDTEQYTTAQLLDRFRSAVSDMSPGSSRTYSTALSCLCRFLQAAGHSFLPVTPGLLGEWLVWLQTEGLTHGTAMTYVTALSGLYGGAASAGVVPCTDAFVGARRSLKTLGKDRWERGIERASFDRLVHLCKICLSADMEGRGPGTAGTILLLVLLGVSPTVGEAAMLRKDSTATMSEEVRRLVSRHTSPRRRYVFDLGQSSHTARQVTDRVRNEIRAVLTARNVPVNGGVDEALRGYRAYAALESGVSAGVVAAALGNAPSGMGSLTLCDKAGIPSSECREIVDRAVERVFVSNPEGWYVMRLRPRVSYGRLCARLRDAFGEGGFPELFYPCEEMTRRSGGRLQSRLRPVIDGVVFFRSRVTDIAPLFSRIGDLAWCYRTGGSAGSYAAVPAESFARFQSAIGQFTPDTPAGEIGELELGADDRVVILGGLFPGREAELTDGGTPGPGGSVIYRLRFFDERGVEWKVSLDSRMIKKQEQPKP